MERWSVPVVVVFMTGFVASALWAGWKRDQKASTPFDADAYIARSFEVASKAAPHSQVASLYAGSVDPDGKVHPELRGSLRLELSSASHPPSNEKPILGAPAPRGPKCPRLSVHTYVHSGSKSRRLYEAEATWIDDEICGPSLPGPVRCGVAAIWRRALADGAPRPAYADVRLETRGTQRRWRFEITDHSEPLEPVVFHREYADDCR